MQIERGRFDQSLRASRRTPLRDRCAVAGHATHLLTGDEKDFGRYFGETIEGVKVVSPKLLAEELADRGLL